MRAWGACGRGSIPRSPTNKTLFVQQPLRMDQHTEIKSMFTPTTRRQFLWLAGGVIAGVTGIDTTEKTGAREQDLKPLPELGPRLTPELEARARGATMMIFGDYENKPRIKQEDYKYYGGSAFHINGDGTIITNRHVVAFICLDWKKVEDLTSNTVAKRIRERTYRPNFVGFSIGHPSIGTIPVDLEYVDDEHDFAVLRYDTTKYSGTKGFAWLPISQQRPHSGDTLHHFTYQADTLNERGMYEIHNHRAIYLGEKNGTMISAESIDPLSSRPMSTGGASGSPLINSRGEVVGILGGTAGNASLFRIHITNMFRQFGYEKPSANITTSGAVPISELQRVKK